MRKFIKKHLAVSQQCVYIYHRKNEVNSRSLYLFRACHLTPYSEFTSFNLLLRLAAFI